MAAPELLASLPDNTRRSLVAPGHDLTTSILPLPIERATRVELSCSVCHYGLTRTIRDREVASATVGAHGAGRRMAALVSLLTPLFEDFAEGHAAELARQTERVATGDKGAV